MNVQGIPTAPVPPTVPTIPRVPQASETATNPQQGKPSDQRANAHDQPIPAALKAPPVKPLSTVEMRVLMGSLPLDALYETKAGRGSFDAYA